MTFLPHPGHVPHAASMAAKNKHRKKSNASRKVVFAEENDMEAENGGEEEDGGSGSDDGVKNDDEEFSLDEVLWLGGTQVCRPCLCS